jgi:hypothetical protein
MNACSTRSAESRPAVDRALRERARTEGRSLNETAVTALAEGVGLGAADVDRRDLSDVAGTWQENAAFDAALAAQDVVDEALWK